jgi:hypothetical protein
MKLTMEDSKGRLTLTVESDGEGRYKVNGHGVTLPRQPEDINYMESEDGFHVAGLLYLMFSANDSREYLTRRLKQHA